IGLGALLLLAPARPVPPVAATAGLLATLFLAAAVTAPRWDPVLMSLGTYRPFHAANLFQSWLGAGAIGEPTHRVAAAQRAPFYREGINASVLVSSDLDGRRRLLRVGGKIDASSGDMVTQTPLGLVPAAVAA